MNVSKKIKNVAVVASAFVISGAATLRAQDAKPASCPVEVWPESVSTFITDRINAVIEQGGNLKVTLPKAMQEIAGSLKACEEMGVLAPSAATDSPWTVTNGQVAQIIANAGPTIAFDDGVVLYAPKAKQPEVRAQAIMDGAHLRETLSQYAPIPQPPPPANAKTCELPEPLQFASVASLIPDVLISGTVMTLMSQGPEKPVNKNQVSIAAATIENINQQLRACVNSYLPNPPAP